MARKKGLLLNESHQVKKQSKPKNKVTLESIAAQNQKILDNQEIIMSMLSKSK